MSIRKPQKPLLDDRLKVLEITSLEKSLIRFQKFDTFKKTLDIQYFIKQSSFLELGKPTE